MKRSCALLGAAVLAGASLSVVTLTGLVPATTASARTLSVPSSYRTINSAISAAKSGDTIAVAPGTYRENVYVNGKYVVLRAISSDPSRTTIIGSGGRSAVVFTNVPRRSSGPRASLIGFRLAGTHTVNGLGGGVSAVNRADPLIERNLIEGNSTTRGGGVIVYGSSSPVIQFNTIRNNRVTIGGAGIFVGMYASPQIYGNVITGNVAAGGRVTGGGPAGGGLYVTNNGNNASAPRSHPNISRNSISDNTASFAGGGLLLGTGADAIVAGNHIVGNHSAYGGGVHIENHGASPSLSVNAIEKNSAARNDAYSGSGSGGGISVFGASAPAIGHNSINYNSASFAGAGIVVAEKSRVSINGNRIAGNQVTRASITGAAGGGIYAALSFARVTNNVIRSNSAPNGGGVAALGNSGFQLVNNTILTNQSTTTQNRAYAGGVYVGSATRGTVPVYNNIVTGNSGYQIAEGGSTVGKYGNNQITNSGLGMFFNYNSHGLTSARAMNNNGNLYYSQGNIDSAPRFVNSGAGDVRVVTGSPGINQGRTTGAAGVDINNRHRPVGPQVDTGVYEQ